MEPTPIPPIESVPHDFSFIGLFLQADPIVKGVMVVLIIASIACWTVVFEKIVRLARARSQAKAFNTLVQTGGALDGNAKGIAGHVVQAALEAWRDHDQTESRAERRDRIERAMRGALTLEVKRLQSGLPLLATSGSTAPFIGLFGTVWGIMNSFSSIAKSQDTSLAVVAPGIAEALFATAIGLVVAIPAVMAYNKLSGDVARIQSSFVSGIGILGNRLARERGGEPRRRRRVIGPRAFGARPARRTSIGDPAAERGRLRIPVAAAPAVPPMPRRADTMAMGSIRNGGDDEDGLDATPMSEINVTPMVDVMLVLLIIFMVAAPLMTTGVPVQLPKTAAAKVAQSQKPLEVSIDKTGQPFIAKDGFTAETLMPRLRELKAQNPDQVVLVRGDKEVAYGKIMEVMGLVGQAGFTKVSLIAQSPGGALPAAAPAAPAAAAPAGGAAR